MTNQVKILAFAGSTSINSVNKKLVNIAIQGAISKGAQVTFLDLRDLPMPFYDDHLEPSQGLDNVLEFRALMRAHNGLLIASPEYNGSVTAVLKNAIDWASRVELPNQPKAEGCFVNKVASIISAAHGGFGGERGLVHLRSILVNVGVIVLPEQRLISRAHEAFDEQGNLKNERHQAETIEQGARLVDIAGKLYH